MGKRLISVAVVMCFACAMILCAYLCKPVEKESMTEDYLNELDTNMVDTLIPIVDGKEYSNIQELVGVVTEPCTCVVKVTYKNSDVETEANAYISFTTEGTEATFTSGDYFHIILPTIE